MSKQHIPGREHKKRQDGTRIKGHKIVSHGTYRCARKPNSPRCKNKA